MGLEILTQADLEVITQVDSETEILEALEMVIRMEVSETQMEVSEIQILADSVILPLSNRDIIITVASDPVTPVDLETAADLIPVVASDLVVHPVVVALEEDRQEVAVLDPVVSDNIQLHKKLLKK